MDIVVLIKSIAGLSALLGLLIFFLFYTPSSKKKEIKKEKKKPLQSIEVNEKKTLNDYLKVLKNQEASQKELQETLDAIIKEYGEIPKKFGARINPEFYMYVEMIMRICRHRNTNKHLIINFYKALEKKNPQYSRELNEALTKGLNSLGS